MGKSSMLTIVAATLTAVAPTSGLFVLPNQCSTGDGRVCPSDCVKAYTDLCANFPVNGPRAGQRPPRLNQSLTSLNVTVGNCVAKWDVTSRQNASIGDPGHLRTLRGICMAWFSEAYRAGKTDDRALSSGSECPSNITIGGVAGYKADYTRNDDPIIAIYPAGTPGQCFATPHPDKADTIFGQDTNCSTNVGIARRDGTTTLTDACRQSIATTAACSLSCLVAFALT